MYLIKRKIKCNKIVIDILLIIESLLNIVIMEYVNIYGLFLECFKK